MRYSASEKLEIIELVEQSTLSVGRTLASIGIPRSTFYDWYGRYPGWGDPISGARTARGLCSRWVEPWLPEPSHIPP